MSLNTEKLLKSTLQRDRIPNIEGLKSIVIDSKVYFFGGIFENNIFQGIYTYDTILKDVVRLPDTNHGCRNTFIIKDNGLIIGNERNELYRLDNDQWVYYKTLPLENADHLGIVTSDNSYIISKGNVFEYDDGDITVLFESEDIHPEYYIPSIDKNVIFFTNGLYDLETNQFLKGTYEGDYIIYNSPQYTNQHVVIDKNKQVIIEYNVPVEKITQKTFSHKTKCIDHISSGYRSLKPINDMVVSQEGFYILEHDGSKHNAYFYDLFSRSLEKHHTLERKNVSYSGNVKYNHYEPYGVLFQDTVAFVGCGGFYKDNSQYDNSVFVNNKIIPIALNIKTPLYDTSNGNIAIADAKNNTIHYYTFEGEALDSLSIQIDQNIQHFKDYDDCIVIDCLNNTYVYDKQLGDYTHKAHKNSIKSCSDKFFKYSVTLKKDMEIVKTSLRSGEEVSYKMPINIYSDDFLIRSSNGHVLLCIHNDNQWEIYRIIFDE